MLSRLIPRPKYSGWTSVVGQVIAKTGVDPNLVTFSAIPVAAVAAWFIATGFFLGGFLFGALAMAIDGIDGAVARASNRVTKFGNYFDALVDKYVEMIFYAGFCVLNPAEYGFFALLAAAGTMLVSYAKPRVAIVIPADNRDWPAIGERVDRLLVLFLGLLTCALFGNVALMPGVDVIKLVLVIVAAVTVMGSVQRIIYGQRLISEFEAAEKKKGGKAK